MDWNNPTNSFSFYDLASNWGDPNAPGPVPDPNDTAQFNLSNTYEVWWNNSTPISTPSVGFLHVLDGEVTFLNVEDPNHLTYAQYELTINGSGSLSDLSISGASTSLTIDGIHLHSLGGAEILDDATVAIDGSASIGSTLTADDNFQVDGTLNVQAGGVVSNYRGYIGDDPNSTGVATVTGAGSQWNNSSELYVGEYGDGTLNVQVGGVVSTTGGHIGFGGSSTSVATVTGSGSQWNNSSMLSVGYNGDGTLNVQAGGVVSNTYGYIGLNPNSTGVATVTDPNSQWNNSSELYVGYSGDGTLNVEAGGVVSNTSGYIGNDPNSTGVATVTDPNSQWKNSGGLYVGNSGDGTLNVQAGGVVSNTNGRIGNDPNSTGVATVTDPNSQWNNSGELTVGNSGDGTLNVQAGGVVSNATGYIGDDPNSTGVVTVTDANSRWNNSALVVGFSGNGTLDISGGGLVTNTVGFIGYNPNSTGAVTVDGTDPNGNPSTWNNSSHLAVGTNGNGTLAITGGGLVINGNGRIGDDPNSTGAVTVAGTDPNGNASTWSNSGYLNVGNIGNGTLDISGGGLVTDTYGVIGDELSTTGVVTVAGVGSQWNNSSYLYVGNGGDGTLNVEASGVVSNTVGYLGLQSTSTSVATVTGSGSQWNNSAELHVGESGNGTLNVEAGGVVSNTIGVIGAFSGSTGVATVTDPNSQWNNSGDLYVGHFGQGTLNIQNDGLVTVGGTTTINSQSVVNLSGGRFEFGSATHDNLTRVNATGGAMAGVVPVDGVTSAAALTALQNTSVDLNDVAVLNSSLLHGTAMLDSSLNNQTAGEVRTLASDWLRFGGTGNVNAGEINNFGGVIEFAQDMTNTSSGFIASRGQFIADGGWTNQGVMAFSGGFADVLGDVANSATGQISVGGASVTTFFDDVTMDPNNLNIDVAAGSTAVFLGSYNGGNDGTGAIDVLGDLRPGNSPAEVTFGGGLTLGSAAGAFVELGGTTPGMFDQLDIAGDFTIAGNLLVSLIDGFTLSLYDEFLIADVDGSRSGEFNGLGEGGLVGNYGGTDLFITYQAGNGNDVGLFAQGLPGDFDGDVDGNDFLLWQRDPSVGSLADWETNYGMVAPLAAAAAAVPEPATGVLLLLGLAAMVRANTKRRLVVAR